MGTGTEKKTWSEDIRRLFAEENAKFSTMKMKKKKKKKNLNSGKKLRSPIPDKVITMIF